MKIENMKKFLIRLLLIVTPFFATACLELEEEISLNKDGSGTYSMTIDMNEMMEMLQGLLSEEQLAETGGGMGQMDSTMESTAETLRSTDGISNVRHKTENYRYSLSYDFSNIDVLNSTSSSSFGSQLNLGMGSDEDERYEWSPKTFERLPISLENLLDEAGEENEQAIEMAKMMLGDASYKMIYHMPGKVKKISNDQAELSEDKKTVTLSVPLIELMEGEANLGNKIKFKKK